MKEPPHVAQSETMVNRAGGRVADLRRLWATHRHRALDLGHVMVGETGRLVFSLVYFVTLARTLELGDFGIFASASAVGVVLARLSGLGFISPLYRVATTRPTLIGAYTAGYATAVVLTLPLLAIATWAIHGLVYAGTVALPVFALIVLGEALLWRTLEATITVQHGLNRFSTAAMLSMAGGATKALTALGFAFYGLSDLEDWAALNACAIGSVALLAVAFTWPRQRLRWRPRAWAGRARDALGVSSAEALFYVQAELDKVLVLALGGPATAGLYAIVMRLADLTAMPMRAMNIMLVQWIMRRPRGRLEARSTVAVEGGIALTSGAALAAMALTLHVLPAWFGDSIAEAATVLALALAVPAFRNLLEYHTELLYAHRAMATRVALLALLSVLKAAMLALVVAGADDFAGLVVRLNVVFAALWAGSALVTYRRLGSIE